MAISKGISPLIDSVLLLAFTITTATVVRPFFTKNLKNTQ